MTASAPAERLTLYSQSHSPYARTTIVFAHEAGVADRPSPAGALVRGLLRAAFDAGECLPRRDAGRPAPRPLPDDGLTS